MYDEDYSDEVFATLNRLRSVTGRIGGANFYYSGGKPCPLVWEMATGHVTCDVVHTQNAVLDLLYITGAC